MERSIAGCEVDFCHSGRSASETLASMSYASVESHDGKPTRCQKNPAPVCGT